MLKVLIVSLSDSGGGAAVVAYRLLCALDATGGVQARMLVAEKRTEDERVTALPRRWWLKKALDRMVVWAANGFSRRGLWLTDGGFYGTDITERPEFQEADVVHLHWVNQGFLSLDNMANILRSGKRVVWTMHDLWPITALCHIPGDCQKYLSDDEACGGCPLLRSRSGKAMSAPVFHAKRLMYGQAKDLRFIAVSQWVKDCFDSSLMAKSAGLRCDVIGNLMPIADFRHERTAREKDEIVLTMGAARLDDPVKGFPLLIEALRECAKDERYGHRLRLTLYGNIRDKRLLNQIAIPYIYKGKVTQKEVAELLRASDIVLSCSACETFGATLAEGIAAGCLAVTTGNGGQGDIVEHLRTGYIVGDGDSLANGILWAAAQAPKTDRQQLHEEMARRFAPEVIAKRHLEIYKKVES